jgi:hypothetical protein
MQNLSNRECGVSIALNMVWFLYEEVLFLP